MSVFLLLLLLVVVLIPRCEILTACSLALEVVTSVWLLALNRQNVAFRSWLKAYLPSSHKYWSVNFWVVLFQCAFSVFLALKFTKTIEMHLKRKSTSWDMLFLCLVSLCHQRNLKMRWLPEGQTLLTAEGPSEEQSAGAPELPSAPFINGVVFSHSSTFSCWLKIVPFYLCQ